MVAVPAPIPVTTPELLTVAIELEVLLQIPPDVVLVSVAVPPAHTDFVPPIGEGADGKGLTVTRILFEAAHPVAVFVSSKV